MNIAVFIIKVPVKNEFITSLSTAAVGVVVVVEAWRLELTQRSP